MNFLNAKVLAQQLRAGDLTERQLFNFYLAGALINSLQVQWSVATSTGATLSWELVVGVVVNIAMLVFGLIWAFRTNLSGDGRQFVQRFLSLSVPVSLQIIAYRVVTYFLYIFMKMYPPTAGFAFPFYSGCQYLLMLLFFVLMQRHIRFVAGREPA